MGVVAERPASGLCPGGGAHGVGENEAPMMRNQLAHSPYWRSTLRLSAVLLGLWLLVTLGVCLLGPGLAFSFFGWPFGFWATAQGALLVFCAIVWVYALAMDRLDAEHGRLPGD
jgi:putative solute:sodium symporter small subunit